MTFVNPLKMREYLSAGLPVVSTAVPEVQRYAHLCHIATTPDEFVVAIPSCSDARTERIANDLLHAIHTLAPVLGGVTGGLSGPAIRPVAVRCVWQVHQVLPHLPILGMGGIRTGLDALQFILAGASAVSVGTAVFGDPSAPARVLAELDQALDDRGFAALADAVGVAHRSVAEPVKESA